MSRMSYYLLELWDHGGQATSGLQTGGGSHGLQTGFLSRECRWLALDAIFL